MSEPHYYMAGLTPDGPFEIRRRDTSKECGYVVVDTARNAARARLLVVRYNRQGNEK